MITKDQIPIILSGSALTLSLISLIITLVQKNRETKRTIRKNLSDALENISKITIESTKLKVSLKPEDYNDRNIVELRRNYNTQRRILMAHADYLVEKYDTIVTDIDCNILATSYGNIGDQEKAEFYWKKTIKKSKSLPIKHMNLRGYGGFLFHNNDISSGRAKYAEALGIKLGENDSDKALLVDTYLFLSDLEKQFGTKELFEYNLTLAMDVCSRVINVSRKEELMATIRLRLPK